MPDWSKGGDTDLIWANQIPSSQEDEDLSTRDQAVELTAFIAQRQDSGEPTSEDPGVALSFRIPLIQ